MSEKPRCARCNLELTNLGVPIGMNQHLCMLCDSLAKHNRLPEMLSLIRSPRFPTLEETHDEAMAEIYHLNVSLGKANQRVAELEARLNTIREALLAHGMAWGLRTHDKRKEVDDE